MDINVTEYQGLTGLEAIAADWQTVLATVTKKRFFHEIAWWKSYLRAVESDFGDMSFFVARHATTPIAILPLKYTSRRLLGWKIRQLGLPDHVCLPLGDILCDRNVHIAEVITALIQMLQMNAKRWDFIVFRRIMAESKVVELSANQWPRVLTKHLKTCDYLAFADKDIKAADILPRKLRSNLSRARKRLTAEKAVTFRKVVLQPELDQCFNEFMDLEASGWKGQQGVSTAIKLHPTILKFYRALIDEFGPSQSVMISRLLVDGRPIAGRFCLKCDDVLYNLKVAYDETWSRLAPGNLLLEWVIHHGIETKQYQYVNVLGAPAWFKEWHPQSQPVYVLWLFNQTLIGRIAFVITKIILYLTPWLRPWYHRLQQCLRRLRILK